MFDDRTAEVREHNAKADGLIFDAKAELNLAEGKGHEAIGHYRAAGEKFVEIKSILGHGYWLAWIEKHAKRPARQVQKIMELAATHPDISDDEARAILWGNGSKVKGKSSPKSDPKYKHDKLWKGFNYLDQHSKALADEKGKPEVYARIKENLDKIETDLVVLETEEE
jgi:hypothetical protein